MFTVIGCLTQQHDLRLVGLAAFICVVACFTSLSILARAQTRGGRQGAWLLAAAATFGGGVWSLHFVSMLAFMPDLPIAYDVPATIASIVIAVTGAWAALLVRQHVPGRAGSTVAGIGLGLSVAGMHYAGVAAMRVPGTLAIDPAMGAGSVALALVLGAIGLARASSLAGVGRRLEVGAWLSLCICSVHFTGMAALQLQPSLRLPDGHAVLGSAALALAVGAVSIALLVVSLALTMMEQHLSTRAVEELRRMRMLSNIAQEVMLIQRDGVVIEANTAGGRLFGVPAESLRGRAVLDLMAESSVPAMRRRERTPFGERRSEELEVRTATGRIVPVELSCSAIDYDGGRAVALSLRDLTDRKRDEARIRHLAHHDALTDLPNRLMLHEHLSRTLDLAGRRGEGAALLYLDLDRFKPVNDLLGHAAGDALLVQVARRLLAELRPDDLLARVGGDEFVLVATAPDQPNGAAALAARLIEVMGRPFMLEGRAVEVGVSIGVAIYPHDGGTEGALLRAADTALYRAKAEQRGSFRLFEPEMDERLRTRRLLEQDLRHAAERGELAVHYQPIVSCRTGRVEGFEALVRWEHPVRGRLSPAEFIPLAEETGLITRIGEWVLNEACAAAASWPGRLWVAVNVSPVQFRRSDLPAIAAAALANAGLPAGRLELEVTEGVLMDHNARALEVLRGLHGLGVRISLDDFGTGFSSLSYLRSFAFDKIKIDRSFVQAMDGGGSEAATIVRAITGLGHSLGLSITAEGVETAQQMEAIRAQGCDNAQGWLIGRPVPQGELARFWTVPALVAAE